MSRPFQEEKGAGGFGLDRSRRRSQARGDGAVCPSGQGGPEKEKQDCLRDNRQIAGGGEGVHRLLPPQQAQAAQGQGLHLIFPGMTTTRARLWR